MSSSYYGSRSTTSIASKTSRITISHSIPGKQLKPKWWQRRPIIQNAIFTDLQKGSYVAAIFITVQCLFQIIFAFFDTYCLIEARPGSRHFRSFGFSFIFVYAGNQYVRWTLILISIILFILACCLMFSSVLLMAALKKERESKFLHWLYIMAIYIGVRIITLIFQSLVNDLYFTYHQMMLFIFIILISIDIFLYLIVISNYQELSDMTRLEDMAKLKMSTLSSLNASRSLSHHSLDSYRDNSYRGGAHNINSHPSPNISIHQHQLNNLNNLNNFNQTPTTQRGSTSINEMMYLRNTSF